MKISSVALALGLASLGVVAHSVVAEAVDFNFSFTGNILTAGSSSGTVTGVISGLTDNATSLPTSVTIDTNPIGVPSGTTLTNLSPSPNDVGFVVSNDVITDTSFLVSNSDNSIQLFLNFKGLNALSSPGGFVENEENFSGVTYTATTVVPEPNQEGLIALGVPLFLGLRMKKCKASKGNCQNLL